jgi:transcription initiation factor TFIIIB Brf1 subunit/transcription initiation factor TFIIB
MDNGFFTLSHGEHGVSTEDALLDAWVASEKDPGYETRNVFKTCTSCGADEDEQFLEEMLVCKSCGEVLARPLDTSAEYRYFGSDDRHGSDPSRVGAPLDPRLPESSLGTIILPRGGSKLSNRIRRIQSWSIPYKERALLGAFERLQLAANNHGFGGSVVDDSKELYVKLNSFCDRRGLSRDSLLASCVYTSLKRAGSPRKPQEIGAMFSLSHATFTKAFKFFQEVLAQATQKGLLSDTWTPSNLATTRASEYVEKPLSELPLTRAMMKKLVAEARALADRAENEEPRNENTPPSLAAGVVAYVCEKAETGIPLARIAESCKVSLATLQKCLRRLQVILDPK